MPLAMGKRAALPVGPTLKHSMDSPGSVPLLKGWKAWSVYRTEAGFSPATCTALLEVQPGPSQVSTESSGLWKDIMRLVCLSPSSSASPWSDCVPGTLDVGAHQGLVLICSLTFTKGSALPPALVLTLEPSGDCLRKYKDAGGKPSLREASLNNNRKNEGRRHPPASPPTTIIST